jgi:membrane associated rhomboid family serine protease
MGWGAVGRGQALWSGRFLLLRKSAGAGLATWAKIGVRTRVVADGRSPKLKPNVRHQNSEIVMLEVLRRLPNPTILALIALAVMVEVESEIGDVSLSGRYGVVPAQVTAAWHGLWSEGLNAATAAAVGWSVWTMVAALFLHGGPEHLLLNMVFLWAFGSLVAQSLGKWWAVLLFLLCGVCGNLTQVALNPESPIPIVGASGSVCGLGGVYLALAMRWELPWPDVWPLAHPIPPMQLAAFSVIGVLIDVYAISTTGGDGPGIAHGAHLGGFASGLVVGLLVTQLYSTRRAWGTESRGSRV